MSEPIEILITMPFPERLIERLAEVSPRLKITVHKAKKVEDISSELWSRVQVLYTNQVVPPPELVPRLRWIQFHWAGVDHIIDDPILRVPGLVATSLSGAVASQMAEYILMILLAMGHRLPDLIAAQKRSDWPSDRWERFSPKELRGSTVGIVGYGSIGRQLARLLYPLGAIVLASKKNAMQPQDDGYIPDGMGDPGGDFVHRLYPNQALHSMLKECDFVVITVPKTPKNTNLIAEEELAVLKPSAYLVDVSRGGILNHQALIQALKANKIAGAALDVYPQEPLPADSPLWKLPNVILTPHIAGNTPHYDERAVDLFAANLQRFLSGQSLYNRIDPEQGY